MPARAEGRVSSDRGTQVFVNKCICVCLSSPCRGALLIPGQVDSGRFSASGTARLGTFALGKEISCFLCLVLTPLSLFFPSLSLKGCHGDTYPMLLQKLGLAQGLNITWSRLSTRWKSGGPNSEACLTLDWQLAQEVGSQPLEVPSHGLMVLENFCVG